MSSDINLENPIIKSMMGLNESKYHKCEHCDFIASDIIQLKTHMVKEHPEIKFNPDPVKHVRKLYRKKKSTYITMGEMFGRKITSRHNQHVLLQIIGKTGMGKSNAGLYIATETSKWIAENVGGNPEDYFTINNCAIMSLESIVPIVKDIDNRRYNIFILDDIGASYGARDYQNAVNKAFNKIIQTFRDSNTLVIFTMPDDFLIDKVPRKLAHFQIEMVTQVFHKKVSIGRLCEMKEIYKNHKTIYPFVQMDGIKYVRAAFKLVEGPLHDEYERRREIVRKKMTKECLDSIDEAMNPPEKVTKIPKYQEIAVQVYQMKQENPGLSNRKIASMVGCDCGTVGKALRYVEKS